MITKFEVLIQHDDKEENTIEEILTMALKDSDYIEESEVIKVTKKETWRLGIYTK
jgi:hypothetical protein